MFLKQQQRQQSVSAGGIRHNTALNSQVSAATLVVRANILQQRRRQQQRGSHPTAMDLVAEEIETVIFGESDDEWEDDQVEEMEERFSENNQANNDDRGQARRTGDASRTPSMLRGTPTLRDARPRRSLIRRLNRPGNTTAAANDNEVSATDSDRININSYTLFDLPDDEGRKGRRRHHPRKGSALSSPSTIIYAKKYHSPGALLMPIILFLSVTFACLLIIRIIMSLLTAAIGVAVLVVLVTRVVQEFITRPIRLIRNFHASPILFMGILGATVGALHAVWEQHLLPLFISSMQQRHILSMESIHEWLMSVVDVMHLITVHNTGTSQVDRIMMWGFLKGLVVGVEVGSIWLIVLGDSARPTALSKYLYRRVWRQVKHQYRRSVVLRQQRCCMRGSSENDWQSEKVICDDLASLSEDSRNQCSICLEAFEESVPDHIADHNESIAAGRSPDRYQLLPCSHCFHRECARHWLTIQQSCPVCRVKVEGMKGCGPTDAS